MKKKEYEELIEKIEKKAKNKSEIQINKLFLNLNFSYIDSDAEFYRNNQEIGEIDGIFTLGDEYLFLIEVDDTSKKEDSKKRGEFYSKWSSQINLEIILEKYKLRREIRVVRIYINSSLKRPVESQKESLSHHKDQYNCVLYKEDVEYFEESFSIVESWARNDFLNFLNLSQKKTSLKKDAIRIFMGTKKAFLFSATAEELLNSCYIYRKSEASLGGYQRILKPNRINKLKDAIKKKKILAFPNSIILSSQYKLEEGYNRETKACEINFPTNPLSFKVVDGQHRLMGFAKLEDNQQKDHNLPVVAFEELGKEDELETFITINTEQKRIDPNLLLILKSDMDWSEDDKFFIEKQITKIVKSLNENKNFFLKNTIYLGYNTPRKGKITLTTLVSAIKKNNLVCGKLHLLQENISDIEKPAAEIEKILVSLKRNLSNYCDIKKASNPEGFLLSNNGLRIVFRLIQLLIRNNNKGDTNISYDDFFTDINSILNNTKVELLMKNYGEGGANNATDKIIIYLRTNFSKKYNEFKTDLRKI